MDNYLRKKEEVKKNIFPAVKLVFVKSNQVYVKKEMSVELGEDINEWHPVNFNWLPIIK